MAEAVPPLVDKLKPAVKRRWRWLKVLVVFFALCFFGWEAYVLSPTVRVGVVWVLGWVGPTAAPAVFGFCQDRDSGVQAAAYDVMARWGAKAVPAVAPGLADPDPRRRELAANVLGRIGPASESAVSGLGAAAKDPDRNLRMAAIVALGFVHGGEDDAAAVQALLPPLHDADPAIRLASLHSLNNFGPAAKGAVSALVERLKGDDDDMVRQWAAEDLGEIGPAAQEAISALKEALKDPVHGVRKEAKEALQEISEPPDSHD